MIQHQTRRATRGRVSGKERFHQVSLLTALELLSGSRLIVRSSEAGAHVPSVRGVLRFMSREAVIILEDDNDHAELFQIALEEARPNALFRRESHTREFLQACRELVDQHRIVAFLDLKVGGESGRAALIEMRNDTSLSEVPAIILSSSERLTDIESCMAAGANGFMTKSFSFAQFVSEIESAVSYWFDDIPPVPDQPHSGLHRQ